MITDYASLQTEIAGWLHRGDLTARIPSFIALAEAQINRKLRVREQETVFPFIPLESGAAALPSDFLEFKALWVDSNPPGDLKPATSEYIRSRAQDASAPQYFAIEGSNVICWPTVGNIKGIYYAKVPALSSTNTTNWLLSASPDLYLAASLAYGFAHTKNSAKAQEWKDIADSIINDMRGAAKAQALGGGALSVRVR